MALTVLIVDDYADARILLSYVLKDAGFHLIYAEDGPQAIAMAREHTPAAIVMDLNLPGMSGVEATRRIKAEPALATIPVVAHTLSTAPLTADHDIFEAVYTKPSTPDVLVGAIQRAIRKRADGVPSER